MCRIKYIANITGVGTELQDKSLASSILFWLYGMGVKSAKTVMFQNIDNLILFKNKTKVNNCRLIPGSGVNLKEHDYRMPSEHGDISFLFVGRIMKDKGIEEYLECARRVKQDFPQIIFDVVGRYDDDSYQGIINRYEEQAIIKYHGEKRNVNPFYYGASAIIQPSHHEGMSNVLLENAACGRPCISSDIPGCREAVDDGITGFLFKMGDVDALESAVRKFITMTHEERENMGIAARKKMENEFDRNIVINAYIEEINKAVVE